ncbi:MAG TPA: response regulator [Bacteroidota bacterium]|jgi:response regulator RpfG family c-di-GMP phosphodiesterase|nr:response regulator [Bacteroidota bacterium]
MKRILIVDDDEGPLSALQEALESSYSIVTAQTIQAAQEILENKEELVDLIISDYHLGKSGTANDLINHIRTHKYLRVRNLPIIIISADRDQKWFIESQNCTFILKPFKLAQLMQTINEKLGE